MNWRLLIITVLLCTSTQVTHAAVIPDDPGNFITTWNTENEGTSNDNQITIPGTGGGYSYEIYWEDTASSTINGTTTLITSSSYTHTFPAPGIYEVQASGTFPRIYFNNGGDREKILTVEQWGNIAWTSMQRAFRGCSNLRVPATDAPDLSGVTDLSWMFQNATAFNDPINHWDVSNISNSRIMFAGAFNFNQPLNSWDVSNVINMNSMFDGYETRAEGYMAFNQPLDNWDVSKVETMQSMFRYTSFNQNINNWDVSRLTGARWLFWNTPFNQPLNDWDVSSTTDFRAMLSGTPFNQPLDQWNTQSAELMGGMFSRASEFNQDISMWDIRSTTDMTDMFKNAGLSTQNQDNILVSWSQQAADYNLNNINFHLGLKSYSATGEAALNTLATTYNWDITEQYQATYMPSEDASLIGDNIQSPLDSGATTTAVTLNPSNNCEFLQWSDGNTYNPRQDVLTDNLNVTAELRCQTYGTSASTQRDKAEEYGNTTQAEEITDRFLTSTSTPAYEAPETLDAALTEVERLPDTINTILETDRSPETISTLIAVLLQLVEVLTQLMLQREG